MRPRPGLRKTRRTVQESSAARRSRRRWSQWIAHRVSGLLPKHLPPPAGRQGPAGGEAGSVIIAVMNWVWANSPTSGNERLVLLAPADACSRDDGTGALPPARHGL
jgi:hypothetical protein